MPKVGDIHVDARIDGSRWPRDLRQIMDKQGREMERAADRHAASYSDGFQRTLSARMTQVGRTALRGMEREVNKSGTRLGTVYSESFGSTLNRRLRSQIDEAIRTTTRLAESNGLARFVAEVGDVDEAMTRMARSLAMVQDAGAATDEEMLDLTDSYTAQRRAIEDKIRVEEEHSASMRRAREHVEGLRRTHKRWLDEEVARIPLLLRNANGAFDDHVRRLGGVDRAYRDLEHRIRVVGTDMGGGWTVRAMNGLTGLGRALTNVGNQASEAGEKVSRGFLSRWRSLGHNARQWTLIIGAILAGMQGIAVLGSAAGAGITTLAGALAQALVGVPALIATFRGLSGELEDLPANMRPVASAFQGIGSAFGELATSIQQRALQDAAGMFDQIADAVRRLAPAFRPMSDAINGLIDDFTTWMTAATDVNGVLTRLIQESAASFDGLARIAGNLGDALLYAFADPAMQRSIQDLLGWIDSLIDSFSNFVRSVNFDQWLSNASRVFGSVGRLLGELGTMLSNLVTPQAVKNVTDMIDSISDMTPALGNMLEMLGELDVFGILVKSLEAVLNVLDPIFRALQPVVGILRDSFLTTLDMIMVVLTPVRISLELLGGVIRAFANYLRPVTQAFGDMWSALSRVADELLTALRPALEAIGDAILAFFPDAESFADIITQVIVPAIEEFASFIQTHIVPAIQMFADFINNVAIPAIDSLMTGFGTIGGAVEWVAGLFGVNTQKARESNQAMKTTYTESSEAATAWQETTENAFEVVNQKLIEHANQVLAARDAERGFEQALDDAREALEENGATLDITTDKGRQNEAALDDMASATFRLYEETLKNTGSQEKANAVFDRGRQELVEMAEQFGMTRAQAERYADELGLIPDDVRTTAVLLGADVVEGRLAELARNRTANIYINPVTGQSQSTYGWDRALAAGDVVTGPTRALIGEAGPEAVVPLNRPLSQVDPSVRWLSAIAQGKGAPQAMASGGVTGGRSTVIEAGAIVVEDRSGDSRRTAVEVLTRIAENVGSF